MIINFCLPKIHGVSKEEGIRAGMTYEDNPEPWQPLESKAQVRKDQDLPLISSTLVCSRLLPFLFPWRHVE
jgi:hypothetical protein